jgi:hypothetical protein
MPLKRPPATFVDIRTELLRLSNYPVDNCCEKPIVELGLTDGQMIRCYFTGIGGDNGGAAIKVMDIETDKEQIIHVDKVVYISSAV